MLNNTCKILIISKFLIIIGTQLVTDRDWVFGRGLDRDDSILAGSVIWSFWDFGTGRDFRKKKTLTKGMT